MKPVFAGRFDPPAARLVDAAGFARRAVDPTALGAEPGPDLDDLDGEITAVVVDSYRLADADLEAIARRHPLVCVDDFAERGAYPCVAVVNVAMHADELSYPATVPFIARGPRFLLVRRALRAFRAAGAARPPGERVEQAVVAIGGVDHHDLGARVVGALASASEPPAVRVLVPSGAPSAALRAAVAAHGRAEIVTGVASLAEVVAGTDAVFAGGGLTKYEAAYAGVATASVVQNPEQARDTERFAALGLGLDLGPAAAEGDHALAAAVDRFVADRAYRRALVETSTRYFPIDPTAAVVAALDDVLVRSGARP